MQHRQHSSAVSSIFRVCSASLSLAGDLVEGQLESNDATRCPALIVGTSGHGGRHFVGIGLKGDLERARKSWNQLSLRWSTVKGYCHYTFKQEY